MHKRQNNSKSSPFWGRWRLAPVGALFLLSTQIHAQREVVLRFSLRNVHEGDTLTLSWGANNKSATPLITSIPLPIEEEITLPLNEPRIVVIGVKGREGAKEVLLSPGENVEISGRLRLGHRYLLPELSIEGAKHQAIYNQAIETYARGKKHQPAKQSQLLDSLVCKHRDSFMGPLLMLRLVGRLDKNYRPLYNLLTDAAKQSYYGREVKDEVYPPTLIGDLAPTVTVHNTQSEEKLLSFIHHNNRYLLLDFWASWCQPCHKEIPNLRALYDKYHSRGLDIIGISTDHHEDDWLTTLSQLNEPWCNYLDHTRQAIVEYKVQYIPSIFIIDADGYIIAEKLRGKELSDFVDNLFKE